MSHARPDWMRPALPARLAAAALTWLGALTMLAPFAWMLTTSLKSRAQALSPTPTLLPPGPPTQWKWHNYAEAWCSARLGDFYLNSLIVALVVTLIAGIHNALAGYAYARLRFPGRRLTFALLLLTMMLPVQVAFIFAYLISARLGYIDNLQALIVPFLASAFGIFYMRQAVASVPDRIEGYLYRAGFPKRYGAAGEYVPRYARIQRTDKLQERLLTLRILENAGGVRPDDRLSVSGLAQRHAGYRCP